MRNQRGISMIALIITIIVIIILAAIVFIASGDTMKKAQLSVFEQEFGDFAMNFKNDPLADKQLLFGQAGKKMTTAQLVYSVVTGADEEDLSGIIVPAGFEYASALSDVGLYKDGQSIELNETIFVNSDDKPYATYWIENDSIVEGYKEGTKFYGDNLGEELHFVTQNGDVFTLPGYPATALVNNEEVNVLYVTTDLYYPAGDDFKDAIYGEKQNIALDAEESDVTIENENAKIVIAKTSRNGSTSSEEPTQV